MEPDSQNTPNITSDIAKKLGFDGMTKEEQEAMIEGIGALILKNVLARSMKEMGEHDASELSLLIDSGADEADILLFLKDRVPDFEAIAEEEAERFRTEALRTLEKLNAGETQ